jgi:hypothetical protein
VMAGVVLAVPVRAALDRRSPSRQDLTAVGMFAAGLGPIPCRDPHRYGPTAERDQCGAAQWPETVATEIGS